MLCRISEPQSKRKTVETLEWDYNRKVPLEKMYRMMDHLYKNIEKAKSLVTKNTLSLFKQEVDVLFFDVTTLYFESFKSDEIRQFGYSKDCKFKETQVVLALVTNIEGHPLSYELFPGNTNEGRTLISVVERMKKDFRVRKAVLVADRAMFTDRNLEFMEERGIEYVVAAKLRSLPRGKKEEILKESLSSKAKGKEGTSLKELEYGGRRLIVSFSTKRAKKNREDRKRLVDRLMTKVKKGEVPVKSLLSNYGTKKYITVEKMVRAKVNKEKIQADALWDGLHGIITNIRGGSLQKSF